MERESCAAFFTARQPEQSCQHRTANSLLVDGIRGVSTSNNRLEGISARARQALGIRLWPVKVGTNTKPKDSHSGNHNSDLSTGIQVVSVRTRDNDDSSSLLRPSQSIAPQRYLASSSTDAATAITVALRQFEQRVMVTDAFRSSSLDDVCFTVPPTQLDPWRISLVSFV